MSYAIGFAASLVEELRMNEHRTHGLNGFARVIICVNLSHLCHLRSNNF
ncbi:MAG TPA: hypothetical protein PLY32_00500 [Salinivirgaceae bacterium]|nr:hypothetical protein [Salinivirgaceae bacterium]